MRADPGAGGHGPGRPVLLCQGALLRLLWPAACTRVLLFPGLSSYTASAEEAIDCPPPPPHIVLQMLRPFERRAKLESRRVAELLAQLPREMQVEAMVQQAASMAEDSDDNEQHRAEEAAVAGSGAMAIAGGTASIPRLRWGSAVDRAKVAPAPGNDGGCKAGTHSGGGSKKGGQGLTIVVSKRGSKDGAGCVCVHARVCV